MNEMVRHRGPDDEGYVFFGESGSFVTKGGVDTPLELFNSTLPYAPRSCMKTEVEISYMLSLGHRRLSIVDVSITGHQPMCTADMRYWIVFNGEVYNHIELRAELELLGESFMSYTDTEVILAAYKRWGKECLHKLNGMFSFLIYDRKLCVLFAARDRFGVKPLYYWVSTQGLALASEIKQFTCLPGWRSILNKSRASDFLTWGITDHTNETMFKGVYQIRGGQAVEMELRHAQSLCDTDGHLPVYQWYELNPPNFEGSYLEAVELFNEKFTDAVRLRLRSDVPVGSCLSGGLDSSSIVCVANKLLQGNNPDVQQRTFSACSHVSRFDESRHIEKVVAHTGVKSDYIYPELDRLFELNEEITWHQDEPFASTSIYAQWNVFKLASENTVKVMLDGQGADELLAGYHSFIAPNLASLLCQGSVKELFYEMRSLSEKHGYSRFHLTKFMVDALAPDWIRQILRRLIGKTAATPCWINSAILDEPPSNPHNMAGRSSIKKLSYAQIMFINLPMLLHWEDRDSMAHSLESRVPFLDYRLVEFCFGLPDNFKFSGGVTKRVLRDSMKGVLPEEIRNRMDKLGFVTPEEVWVKETGTAQFRQALLEAVEASQGVLNEHAIDCFEEIVAGSRPFSFSVWRMISFGCWMKKFNVSIA